MRVWKISEYACNVSGGKMIFSIEKNIFRLILRHAYYRGPHMLMNYKTTSSCKIDNTETNLTCY